MAVSESERDPIELLASEFLERHRRSEQPTIEEYTERHPELADEIRDALTSLLALEQLKRKKESDAHGRASLGPRQLKQLGDFRIEREIGRGGMGVVYEATQESLHRRVALKVLPHAHLDERRVKRFQREALTAANLNHPNIVPVFGVGEQDGIHYYVMQCIDGVGLDAKFTRSSGRRRASTIHEEETLVDGGGESGGAARRESSSESPPQASDGSPPLVDDATGLPLFREIARIGAQAAAALEYAHQRGVLHRDIKPSNLILDTQGSIWIADFGLAKAIEAANISQSGELVGTLRYMAPERLHGESDPRGDVYSLGATLYELLTRQTLFGGAEGQKLVEQIARGQPAAPRKLMPQIPRDLETIVLKAIARESSRRYRSAGEMADDLNRWLSHRPIAARRVSPLERARMWAHRSPAVAGLSAAVCLLLVVVLAMAGREYLQAKQDAASASAALVVEEQRRIEQEQLRIVAEKKSEQAIAALNQIFDQLRTRRSGTAHPVVSDNPQRPPKLLSQEEWGALETMLPLQEQLAASTGNSAEMNRDVAVATRRVADIYRMLGRYQEAIVAYGEARRKLLGLENSPSSALQLEIASLDNDLSTAMWMLQQWSDARQANLRALERLEPLADDEQSATDDVRFQLARTYYLLAKPKGVEAGPPPPPSQTLGAVAHFGGGGFDEPGGELDGLPRQRPPPGRRGMGPPPFGGPPRRGGRPPPGERPTLGERPLHRGPPHGGPARGGGNPGSHAPGHEFLTDEALAYSEQAIALLDDLLTTNPEQAEYRYLLARAHRDVAASCAPEEAEQHMSQAVSLLEALTREFPDVAEYRGDLIASYASSLYGLTWLNDNEMRPLLEEQLRRALELSDEFVRRYPQVPGFTMQRVAILFRLGLLLMGDEDGREAESMFRKAETLVTPLVEHAPEVPTYKLWQSAARLSIAGICRQRGDAAEARRLVELAVYAFDEGEDTHGAAIGILADGYLMLAELQSEAGESDEEARRIEREFRSRMHMPPPRP